MIRYMKGCLLTIFLCFMGAVWAESTGTWQVGKVSEDIINNSGEMDSLDNVERFYLDKKITLKSGVLHVGDISCKVIHRKIKPLEYWMSDKTISFYRDFFKRYDAVIPDEISYISVASPDAPCQHPFSEFIEINGDLVFFYKNRVAWYYPENDKLLDRDKAVTESDTVICENSSNEMDVVYQQGFIMSCFYPDIDLISAYNKSREAYKQDEALKMLKSDIKRGRNEYVVITSDFTFDYRWTSKNELEIIVEQPGGTTTLIYLQKKSGTMVKSISSPD